MELKDPTLSLFLFNITNTGLLQTRMGLPVYALSFLLGCVGLQMFPRLPAIEWLLLLPLLLVALYFVRSRGLLALIWLALGTLWSLLSAHSYALHVLPESRAGEAGWVIGRVSDLPRRDGHILRFEFEVQQFDNATAGNTPQRLRLSWYQAERMVHAGETWRLQVKLKPPHGFMNPGGFDYEQWLYQRGIHATGYVKNAAANERLQAAPWYSLDRLRERIAARLVAEGGAFGALWAALAVGDKSAISAEDWQLLTATGTNHLMAISGLHIGLVAGLVFWLARRALPMTWLRRYTAQQMAAVLALLAALIYAALAGFAIPTQRALVMLAVVLVAVMLNRPVRPGQSLALALLLVLVIDPRSVLAAGFWFSFMAVAVIAYAFAGRLAPAPRWQQWLQVQWVIALALLPVSLFLFQQGSLAAPLANLLAVPLVSLLVVPLVLLALLAWPMGILFKGLLTLAGWVMTPLWAGLGWLAGHPLAVWQQHWPSWPLLLLALAGLALLLAPRGVPQRWLGALLVLPGVLNAPNRPSEGGFWLTLLDVGQGLAVYVETRQHNLLFDTGARFSPRFDIGERVVVPFLRSRGIETLDKLVISHGDNDHRGGAESILAAIAVEQIEGQDLDRLDDVTGTACRAGMSWRWDGVEFRYLHPDRDYRKTNNHACVLQISSPAGRLLIAADIEAKVEAGMLQRDAASLPADVLVVPHHGSHSSSSTAWLSAVHPRLALISAGYRNRFGHPAEAVVKRYRQQGARVLNTASSGAIAIRFESGEPDLRASRYRQHSGRYWHHWTLR